MITKLLHARTKIFFPDPYVVRIEYDDGGSDQDRMSDYRKIVRNTYKLINGTWGYSELLCESITTGRSPVASHAVQVFVSSNDSVFAYRGYFCFKDELDALQFRLTIATRAIQVKMWPMLWFTIHEVVEMPDDVSTIVTPIKYSDKYSD